MLLPYLCRLQCRPLQSPEYSLHLTTCGTSTIVVSSPICPPASVSFSNDLHLRRNAPYVWQVPYRSNDRNHLNSGCFPVCHVFFPDFLHLLSLPLTSFFQNYLCNFCLIPEFISIIFTPNGLSVSFFVSRICSLTHSAGAPPAARSAQHHRHWIRLLPDDSLQPRPYRPESPDTQFLIIL